MDADGGVPGGESPRRQAHHPGHQHLGHEGPHPRQVHGEGARNLLGNLKIAQDNYPESLAAAYVVNAPSYFTVIWAVIKSFLDPKTVAKVHIYGSGPKMFAKLKNALGPGCFIAEDMVCCKKSQVGAAELTMGLQSAMAASQTWIRERRESGIPWHAASAAESTTRLDGAGDDPSSATAAR